MASCSRAAAAPKKRKRFAVGSTEEFEQMHQLGKGGYGAVVMARHRATGHVVAIKRLEATVPSSSSSKNNAAVLREARFLEACRGIPFVVGFHGLVRDPGAAADDLRLVMECVGPSLRDVLRRRRRGDPPLPEATVRAVMWQLLRGAKAMHGRHVAHRDLKPGNILVDLRRGVVKICDFGLALHMSEPPPPYDEEESAAVGTLWYAAPEVLLGRADYDALVDMWSLGCVMAELVGGGGVLFQGLNNEGQMCSILDVLGAPDRRAWPWFFSTPFATGLLPQLYVPKRNLLRERFPETMLSKQGFEVLNGLLTWNPDRRLTATAALKRPWFADLAAPRPTPALPNIKDPLMVATGMNKRQKVQCA